MSQPFPGIPERGSTPPFKRRTQPGSVQNAVKAALRGVKPYCERVVRDGKRHGQDLWRRGKRGGQDLWMKGKRNPRTVGIAAGAVAVTLVGAIAVSATGAGPSLCPPVTDGKTAPFVLLMDPVSSAVAGSELEIHYDVCGLRSGTPYTGKIRLTQQKQPRRHRRRSRQSSPSVTRSTARRLGGSRRSSRRPRKPASTLSSYRLWISRGGSERRAEKVVIRAR